jgi:hypothetical protein
MVVGSRWGTSRDESVRRLLSAHVARQEQEEPEDRLTHISTLVRYPRPPRWRGDEQSAVLVRVRAPELLLVRARSVSLRLPGQYQRANRDYQARVLTDAVTTAIATAEPFTDDFLQGLTPLMRHGSALALWQLVQARTSTGPEREVLVAAEAVRTAHFMKTMPFTPDEQLLLDVATALECDEGWHSSDRFDTATALARKYLSGPRAAAWEEEFHHRGPAWDVIYQDLLQSQTNEASGALKSTFGYDYTGRGGTAVWRARRRVYLDDFTRWLVERRPAAAEASVMGDTGDDAMPGWVVRTPSAWIAESSQEVVPSLRHDQLTGWTATGKVLVFPYGRRRVFWPLTRLSQSPVACPVPGFEVLGAAAADLRPDQVIGFIEALLIDWNEAPPQEPPVDIALDLPVDKARLHGFLSASQEQQIRADARVKNLERMDEYISWAAGDGAEAAELQLLLRARGNAREFQRLTRERTSWFGTERATWRWPGKSVAAELVAGRSAETLSWLATEALRSRNRLAERAMQVAWSRAFERFGFRGRKAVDRFGFRDGRAPDPPIKGL